MLTRLIDVVSPFLQTKSAHRAQVQQRKPKRIKIQLVGIKIFIFRMPHISEKLRRTVFDSCQLHIRSLSLIRLNQIVEIAEQIRTAVIQYVLGFNISMCQAFLLQLLQHRHHLRDKTVYLLFAEMLIFLSSKTHILMQIHLIFLHEEQQRKMLFLLHPLVFQTLAFIPAYLRAVEAQSQQRSDVAMFYPIYQLENLHYLITIGYLFDYIAYFCLLVAVNAYHVFASAQQLDVFKLLEAVKLERTHRFAHSIFHDLYDM